ncbi:XAC0095 family protein [Lysobacter enzymogenes]|uniref:XAC0095 family protein n=1 Tax=Lysobacter enzymogenes TaxID=69 RepID=UPI003CCCF095
MRVKCHDSVCFGALIDGRLKELVRVRDQLRLLAQLTEPQGEAGADVVYLSAEALAQCFDRFADDLDVVVVAIRSMP